MKNKLIILSLIFLISIISVSAINLNNAVCYDDGSFEITLKANSEKYAYTDEMIISANSKKVKGNWDNDKIRLASSAENKYATFIGLENQLIEDKDYEMKIFYKLRTEDSEEDAELSFNLNCPGLMFTCHKLGIKIKDCITSKSGKFTANMEIYGLEQSQRGQMDSLEVIDFILDTQILYKDIKGHTSKRGSLPEGAIVKKTGDNNYLIESYFAKYTTNHVKTMWVKFNDNLKKPCNPVNYPDVIFTDTKECEYKETEEDILAAQKQREEQKKLEEFKEEVKEEPQIDEPQNTGYSIKEPTDSLTKKKGQLKIMIFFLVGIVTLGGLLLLYLYKEGYFF